MSRIISFQSIFQSFPVFTTVRAGEDDYTFPSLGCDPLGFVIIAQPGLVSEIEKNISYSGKATYVLVSPIICSFMAVIMKQFHDTNKTI